MGESSEATSASCAWPRRSARRAPPAHDRPVRRNLRLELRAADLHDRVSLANEASHDLWRDDGDRVLLAVDEGRRALSRNINKVSEPFFARAIRVFLEFVAHVLARINDESGERFVALHPVIPRATRNARCCASAFHRSDLHKLAQRAFLCSLLRRLRIWTLRRDSVVAHASLSVGSSECSGFV
jgi:hypothetical protein